MPVRSCSRQRCRPQIQCFGDRAPDSARGSAAGQFLHRDRALCSLISGCSSHSRRNASSPRVATSCAKERPAGISGSKAAVSYFLIRVARHPARERANRPGTSRATRETRSARPATFRPARRALHAPRCSSSAFKSQRSPLIDGIPEDEPETAPVDPVMRNRSRSGCACSKSSRFKIKGPTKKEYQGNAAAFRHRKAKRAPGTGRNQSALDFHIAKCISHRGYQNEGAEREAREISKLGGDPPAGLLQELQAFAKRVWLCRSSSSGSSS